MINPEKDKLWDRIDELLDIKVLRDGLSPAEQKELEELTDRHEAILAQERADEDYKRIKRRKVAKKVNKQFKRDEDWVCQQLGLEREGHMKRGLSCPDGVDDLFSVDVTRTKEKLSFIHHEMEDAKAHATQGRTPVVVIFQDGYDRNHGLVFVEFRNWRDLHGK